MCAAYFETDRNYRGKSTDDVPWNDNEPAYQCKKYRPNYELWKSVSTPGEQPDEYVQRELKGERHFGETPVDMTADVLRFSAEAVREIYKAKIEVYRAT